MASIPPIPSADFGPSGPYGGMGPTIVSVAWVEFFLATTLILLRLYARYTSSRHGGWALSWISFSWLFGFVAQIFITIAIANSDNGFSASWTVPRALMFTWVSVYLTFIAVGLGKVSAVAFILSLQGPTHQKMRYFLHFIAYSNMVTNFAFVLYLVFRCSPPSNVWAINDPTKCNSNFESSQNFGYFVGAWNAASDLFLAFYPIYLFHQIAIPRKTKIAVSFLMSLGFIAAICAGVKAWHIRHVTATTHLSYEIFCLLIWTFTEMWIVLMCTSIPPLWPLLKPAGQGFVARMGSWLSSGSDSSGSGVGQGSGMRKFISARRARWSLHHPRSKSAQGLIGVGGRVDSALSSEKVAGMAGVTSTLTNATTTDLEKSALVSTTQSFNGTKSAGQIHDASSIQALPPIAATRNTASPTPRRLAPQIPSADVLNSVIRASEDNLNSSAAPEEGGPYQGTDLGGRSIVFTGGPSPAGGYDVYLPERGIVVTRDIVVRHEEREGSAGLMMPVTLESSGAVIDDQEAVVDEATDGEEEVGDDERDQAKWLRRELGLKRSPSRQDVLGRSGSGSRSRSRMRDLRPDDVVQLRNEK